MALQRATAWALNVKRGYAVDNVSVRRPKQLPLKVYMRTRKINRSKRKQAVTILFQLFFSFSLFFHFFWICFHIPAKAWDLGLLSSDLRVLADLLYSSVFSGAIYLRNYENIRVVSSLSVRTICTVLTARFVLFCQKQCP